jgi:hypothetical protein
VQCQQLKELVHEMKDSRVGLELINISLHHGNLKEVGCGLNQSGHLSFPLRYDTITQSHTQSHTHTLKQYSNSLKAISPLILSVWFRLPEGRELCYLRELLHPASIGCMYINRYYSYMIFKLHQPRREVLQQHIKVVRVVFVSVPGQHL